MKLTVALLFALALHAADPVRVRLVTGGHNHDPEFYLPFINEPRMAVSVEPHPNSPWLKSAERAKTIEGGNVPR
jgi:hypothetical protein